MPVPGQETPIVATITISMNATGGVSVNGPLENKLLMYGLLEVAKDLVREQEKKNEKKVIAPPAGAAAFFGKR